MVKEMEFCQFNNPFPLTPFNFPHMFQYGVQQFIIIYIDLKFDFITKHGYEKVHVLTCAFSCHCLKSIEIIIFLNNNDPNYINT